MTDDSALLALADEQYALLTTTRRSGAAVPTPVWLARDGDALIVTTGAESGKVARIRHTPRVTLQACDRAGRPREGAPVLTAHASILEDEASAARLDDVFVEKYGAAYRAMRALGKVRGRSRSASVVVRIMET